MFSTNGSKQFKCRYITTVILNRTVGDTYIYVHETNAYSYKLWQKFSFNCIPTIRYAYDTKFLIKP